MDTKHIQNVTETDNSSPSASLYHKGIDKSSSTLNSWLPIADKIGASFIALIEIVITASVDAPFVFPEFSTVNLISSVPE